MPCLAVAQLQTEYWPNNNKKSEGKRVNGKEDSTWTFWFEKGNISAVINYKEGQIDGKFIYYQSNGAKQQRGTQKDGLYHDSLITYHPNGKMKNLTLYKEGKRHGSYKEWYDNEKLMLEGLYPDYPGVYYYAFGL